MTDYERIKREYDLSLLQKDRLMSKVYPVGSIYMSINAVSPSALFGGVWERIENAFLLAASKEHPAGEAGGEEKHALSVEEVPKISFNIPHIAGFNQGTEVGYAGENVKHSTIPNADNYEGSSQPLAGAFWHYLEFGADQEHNNMPPYLSVYMWVRIK